MTFLRKLLDFYLYSSIHIALGASLSVLLCYAALVHIPTSDYAFFVFSSTLFLYCIHRIVGINKVRAFEKQGRFAIIKKFRNHLLIYTILGGLASTYFYFNLPLEIKLLLILPSVISILYVLPLFAGNKRLRDYFLIKIFLIAISWGLIIGLIPFWEVNSQIGSNGTLYFLEKVSFIFAITLPFDVRDLKVDASNKVETIPSKLGASKTYILAYSSVASAIVLVILQVLRGVYSNTLGMGLGIGYLATMLVIRISKNKQNDYYFSGLLDGTIILVSLVGIAMSGILTLLF